jgi:hypothetical protein
LFKNKFVYFKGSGVEIPRYPVTVIGKKQPLEATGFMRKKANPGRLAE